MSTNIPKKLELKAELLRHLETAKKLNAEGAVSSYAKVETLELEVKRIDMGFDPFYRIDQWREWLGNK